MRTSAKLCPDSAEDGHLHFVSAEGKGEEERGEEMKWISVDDRLPEHCIDYLCIRNNGRFEVCTYYPSPINKWGTGGQKEITHWQPLPEPPQEKKKCNK